MNRILVIEDNGEVRENTAELLEISGYLVRTAENGKEGFEEAVSFKPDIILCDMMMPKMDGTAFFKVIKGHESTSKIPIIFFSAGTPFAKVRKLLMEQGDAYLSKPFTMEELMAAIAKFVKPESNAKK